MAGASWVLAASTAQAVSFGRPPASVALGSTLNLVLPLRLDPGEPFEPECIGAEVQIGDRRVPAHSLRWAVEPGASANERLVRVMSLVVVDEPVVVVQVSSGCTNRISRRFTAFADPPLTRAAAPGLGVSSAEPAATAALPPRTLPPVERVVATERSAASAPTMRMPKKPRRGTAFAQRSPRSRADAVPTPPPAARLSLEASDPDVLRQAVAAAMAEHQASAALNAQSASAAVAAASAAADRVQALEEQVQRLLADGKVHREELQQLRTRAVRSDAASRWLPWLSVALILCLAAVVWLVLKLRRQQRDAQAHWWADAAEVLADARPDPPPQRATPAAVAAVVAAAPARTPAWPPAAAADPPAELNPAPATMALDTALGPVTVEPGWTTTSPPPRAVSIEELIDLEQQAEFFVVLGQDDAAIDLLMGHLRDTGGTSPLPYLKLLEIYRRRGEREAYERTRERFNQRFNGYAPDWDTDMLQGRTLVDYPQAMLRLQRAWTLPIDAMAELETLMFRKDGGELFELPAYREVLMLYSLARDLFDHQGARLADVDVLLPLDAAGQGPLAPARDVPGVGDATMVLTPDLTLDGPTQFHAVDLDLGQSPAAEAPVTPPIVRSRKRS